MASAMPPKPATQAALQIAEKTRFCSCFWVAQRFTAAISGLFSATALAAEGGCGPRLPSCKAFMNPARKFDMAETKMAETKDVRRPCRAGLRIVATLVATVFSLLFAAWPAHAADQPGAECLACHGDKSMST